MIFYGKVNCLSTLWDSWLLFSLFIYRIAGLIRLHNNLRSEMWTWQLAESLLKDIVNSELTPEDEFMVDDDESQTVNFTMCLLKLFHFWLQYKTTKCKELKSLYVELVVHYQVTTDHQLMEQFFSQNEKVRRCQIVIDWLETCNREDVLDGFYNKVQYFTENTSAMWWVDYVVSVLCG